MVNASYAEKQWLVGPTSFQDYLVCRFQFLSAIFFFFQCDRLFERKLCIRHRNVGLFVLYRLSPHFTIENAIFQWQDWRSHSSYIAEIYWPLLIDFVAHIAFTHADDTRVIAASVILRVCVFVRTIKPKRLNYKHQTCHGDSPSRVLGLLAHQLILGQKVKGHRVTKIHIEGDRVADVSYALYRVPMLNTTEKN